MFRGKAFFAPKLLFRTKKICTKKPRRCKIEKKVFFWKSSTNTKIYFIPKKNCFLQRKTILCTIIFFIFFFVNVQQKFSVFVHSPHATSRKKATTSDLDFCKFRHIIDIPSFFVLTIKMSIVVFVSENLFLHEKIWKGPQPSLFES